MSDFETLRTPEAVKTAILRVDSREHALALAASQLVMPGQFRFIQPPDEEPVERQICGLTAITISPSCEVSFRSATFGVTSGRQIAEIDSAGTGQAIQRGVPIDTLKDERPISTTIATSKTMLSTLFHSIQNEDQGVVGGVIFTPSSVNLPGLDVRTYTSEAFAAYSERGANHPVGRLVTRLNMIRKGRGHIKDSITEIGGGDYKTGRARMALSYSLSTIASQAVIRGKGPVVVKQKLYSRF